MSSLNVKTPRKEQPQYAAPLDKKHQLAKDFTFFINCAVPQFNAATGKTVPITLGGTGTAQRGSPHGVSLWTPNDSWLNYDVQQDWSGPGTFYMLCRINAIDPQWGSFFTKDASPTVGQIGIGRFSVENDIYGTTGPTVANRITNLHVSDLVGYNILAFSTTAAGDGLNAYVNGVYIGSSASSDAQTAGTGALGLGRSRLESTTDNDCDVDWLAVGRANRVHSAAEIYSLSHNRQAIWQLLQAPVRRLSIASSSSGVSGTVAYTNANDTLAASGTTTVTGSLAKTNANDTSAASGTTTVTGSLAKTNANDTVSASGAVGSDVTGTVSYTNANDTSAASGTTTVTGSASKANANDTSAASGATTVTGSLAKINANDTLSATGAVGSVSGTVDYTNRNDTSSASGEIGANLEQGGDDFPGIVIEKRRKKTLAEQPNKHLENIIDEAVKEVFGRESGPGLIHNEINGLEEEKAQKEPKKAIVGSGPQKDETSLLSQEVIDGEAEKVAALLAQYQEQVRLAQMQEDEELLIMIMGAF